jgi:hypothetical protein
MLRRSLLVLVAVAGASCLTAATAMASTRCFCKDGMTVESMVDAGDDDDCNDACDDFGGGRLWTPADAESTATGGSDTTVRNPAAVEGAPAAERRAVERQR